ncbi:MULTISPECIES: hypothetical protein [unclassified Caulobacter]|jgi:hypothetical protein|uniref:hypothetical protein n=1 Tax=unclassified Caulobacter TaxID=2648921 RepID=UPI000781FAC6|nr:MULTISPECIES: hypothetical protein [unclassified Caulobacter]AZS20133.1 hypothetical protein CSW63_05415 [Caulobacter sp. FWC26]
MTAIACLRILFTADGDMRPGDMPKHKAQGVADAFLKAKWRAPRKCGAVAPLAFVLADHKAQHLDPREVQGLAVELEKVLFPNRPIGQIALMTFEGDETAVLHFAALSQKELAGLMAGEGYGGEPGRVHVVTADAIKPMPVTREEAKAYAADKAKAVEAEKPTAKAAPAPAPAAAKVSAPQKPADTGWWGVYDLPQSAFVGSAIGLRADLVEPPPEDDTKLLKRDLVALTDVQAVLKSSPFGEIQASFGFWNLITPASQESYKARLSRYPLDARSRLTASIYGAPREASIGMLQQMRVQLSGAFAAMDLRIIDPTFPVQGLPPELLESVTLVLSGETEHERLKQILKFVERKSAYAAKGVMQCVANVASAVELEACKVAGVVRVQGPAITDFMDAPVAAADGAPLALAQSAA